MIEVGKTYIGSHGHHATVTAIAGSKVYIFPLLHDVLKVYQHDGD